MRIADAEERAYSGILQAIAEQKYAPGDRLTEAKIAEELNMSRTPIRNALKKMVASGMLEFNRNVGCVIPQLTPHDMADVFFIRTQLEGQAAEIAAKRATRVEIERLLGLLDEEKELYSSGETAAYTKLNEALHLGIAALTKNSYLERFISQAFWRSELYIIFFDRFYLKSGLNGGKPMRNPHESQSCREHEELLAAIASRDTTAANAAMSSHIKSTYETLTRRVWVY